MANTLSEECGRLEALNRELLERLGDLVSTLESNQPLSLKVHEQIGYARKTIAKAEKGIAPRKSRKPKDTDTGRAPTSESVCSECFRLLSDCNCPKPPTGHDPYLEGIMSRPNTPNIFEAEKGG